MQHHVQGTETCQITCPSHHEAIRAKKSQDSANSMKEQNHRIRKVAANKAGNIFSIASLTLSVIEKPGARPQGRAVQYIPWADEASLGSGTRSMFEQALEC